MFDYSITKRPCFLYYPDLEEYTSRDRNLYFDIGTLPFIGAHTQDELLQNIAEFSLERYTDSIDVFLEQIGSYDDGHAGERVTKLIEEVMK